VLLLPLVRVATEGKFFENFARKSQFWQDFQVIHAHNRADQSALL